MVAKSKAALGNYWSCWHWARGCHRVDYLWLPARLDRLQWKQQIGQNALGLAATAYNPPGACYWWTLVQSGTEGKRTEDGRPACSNRARSSGETCSNRTGD